jgi:hypothetical protein
MPLLAFNTLRTDSEISEQNGLLTSNYERRGARKALPHSDPDPDGREALGSTPRAVQGIPVDQTTGQRAPLLARSCAACRVLAGKRESAACRCPV